MEMKGITQERLQQLLDQQFHGLLRSGAHPESSHACALELMSVAQEIPWTDDPFQVRTFDLRPLNDMPVSDELRTKYLIPLLAQYANSLDWPLQKQEKVVTKIVILTVQRLIAELPRLPEDIRQKCREATTLQKAAEAAGAARAARIAEAGEAAEADWASRAAEAAGAAGAARAAEAAEAAGAAWAARTARAAEAATGAKIERIFLQACQLWMEAVQEELLCGTK